MSLLCVFCEKRFPLGHVCLCRGPLQSDFEAEEWSGELGEFFPSCEDLEVTLTEDELPSDEELHAVLYPEHAAECLHSELAQVTESKFFQILKKLTFSECNKFLFFQSTPEMLPGTIRQLRRFRRR